MKNRLHSTKNLFLSLILLVTSLLTQNTYAMEEEEEIKNKFFITHVTNTTKKNLVFMINNKPTGIKAGETKNLRREVGPGIKIVFIIDPQTGKEPLWITFYGDEFKLMDAKFSKPSYTHSYEQYEKNTQTLESLKFNVPKDKTHRFNIQLVLKEGKERLEDSELDVLAEGKFLGYK